MTTKDNKQIYYSTDLAFVHDYGHGQYAQNAALTISKLINVDSKDSLIVDLGCGSGILERELASKKMNIIGVDYSNSMIELAKQNAPEATFLTKSIYDFEIPECILVCSIGECFNYLFDIKGDLNELKELFARVYSSLKPDGYFVFDILTPELLETPYANSRIIERELWTIFLDIKADKDEKILTRQITLFLKKEECYNKSKEVHRQRLFHEDDIKSILTDIGFSPTLITDYNGLKFRSGHIGFICKKN